MVGRFGGLGDGLRLAVLGLGLDDLDQGVPVLVDELQVGEALDGHGVRERECALDLLHGRRGLGGRELAGVADLVFPAKEVREEGVGPYAQGL